MIPCLKSESLSGSVTFIGRLLRDQAKLTNVRVLEPTALRSVECLKTPIEAMRFADLVRDLDRASVEIVWALTW